MHEIPLEAMINALNQKVSGSLCVSVWLGHADVLFLGFGTEILPKPLQINASNQKPRFLHLKSAPNELQTRFGDWWIEHGTTMIGSSYEDPRAEQAALMLVGKRAKSWNFIYPDWGLCIEFDEDLTFYVIPYDAEDQEEVWSFRDKEGMQLIMMSSGTAIQRHSTERIP